MVSRMNQNDSRLMTQTRGRILGVSALALTFAAGLASPALAQQPAQVGLAPGIAGGNGVGKFAHGPMVI